MALFLALAPTAMAWTWYVDGVNGNDNNDCMTPQTACKTIGRAISHARRGEIISIAAATYTENLTINKSLKVIGSGAATTIVDGNQAGTVFTISNATANVLLSELTIRNGNALNVSQEGGGILNSGMLTINKSTITGNSAKIGGGILNGGALTINNSTISGNRLAYHGGGIDNYGGTVAISNSTVSGNRAVFGGGIFTGGTVAINNSTISGNSAPSGAGISYSDNTGTTLQNTIIANPDGENCSLYGGTVSSNGYNLSSDDTCNFNGPGDMNNTIPLLGKFGYHGGPTQTIPLLLGSPAIDAGNPSGCTDSTGKLLKTDQRGYPRPGKYDSGGCDMGAFEQQKD